MTDHAEAPEPYPEMFLSEVRDALAHLYDYAHLENHPLVRLLTAEEIQRAAGHSLRNLLLDTIEALHPGEGVSRNDRAWRPYGTLVHRYVDGYEIDDILAGLNVSLRQFQRDHRKGIMAVASMLWRRGLEMQSAPEPSGGATEGILGQEMARLAAK